MDSTPLPIQHRKVIRKMGSTVFGMELIRCGVLSLFFFQGCFFSKNNEAYIVTAAMDLPKNFQFLSPAVPPTKDDIERMR
jgi:hypothetical protein